MNKRIKTIDGLRGIAVLLVVGFHLINNQISANPDFHFNFFTTLLFKLTYFGWCGVDLFFVMSGFLIGSILLENRTSRNFFKTFYIRRFLRIVPIFYLLLVVFFILKHTNLYNPNAYIFMKDIPLIYYFLFLQNFVMTSLNHFGPEAITPTWSLAVEEQFYLIIPWIVYYLKPKQFKYFIIACLICGPVSRYFNSTFYGKYTLLNCRIDSPIIGFCIAYLYKDFVLQNYILTNFRKIKMISLLVIIISILIYVFGKTGPFNHTLLAIIFGLILIISLYTTKGFLYEILTAKWLVFIGGISYFLYLYHQIINGLLHIILLDHPIPIIDGFYSLIVTFIGLAITICMSIISYKYLESPLIKYSHKFKY